MTGLGVVEAGMHVRFGSFAASRRECVIDLADALRCRDVITIWIGKTSFVQRILSVAVRVATHLQ